MERPEDMATDIDGFLKQVGRSRNDTARHVTPTGMEEQDML